MINSIRLVLYALVLLVVYYENGISSVICWGLGMLIGTALEKLFKSDK